MSISLIHHCGSVTIFRRFSSLWLPSSEVTNESSRLKIVNLLASVSEPQSCQTYLASHSGLLSQDYILTHVIYL